MCGIRFSFLLLLFMFSLKELYSQGEFLYKGESGFGTSIGIAKAENLVSYEFSLGYAPTDFIDFTLSIGRLEELGSSEASGSPIGTSVALYPTKQEKNGNRPTLGFYIGYTYVSITGRNAKSSSGGALAAGLLMTKQIIESDHILIQPLFQGGHIFGKESGVVGSISLALGYRFVGGGLIAFSPNVMYTAKQKAFGGSVSLVF